MRSVGIGVFILAIIGFVWEASMPDHLSGKIGDALRWVTGRHRPRMRGRVPCHEDSPLSIDERVELARIERLYKRSARAPRYPRKKAPREQP